jgi:hypothetical protein
MSLQTLSSTSPDVRRQSWTPLLSVVIAAKLCLQHRLADERGEGVISTAIAVLIVALLGAGMWAAFQTIFDGATSNIGSAIDSIGG